jgi:hypothetical protein
MNMKNILLSCAVALGATAALAEDDYNASPATTDDTMDDGIDDVDVDVTTEADGDGVDVNVNTDEAALEAKADDVANTTARAIDPRNSMLAGGLGTVKVLAGTGDFTQAGPRDITGIGPSWDVRGVFGAHSPVGLEAAYVGSARGIGGLGVDDQSALVSNGAETDLRLAAPIRAGENIDVRPFAFGGVGWQYMTLWGDGAVDGARDPGDHILTIPAGVGLELGVGALNVDLRGTYRHAVDSEIFGDATAEFDDPNALHSYNVSAGLGFEF